MGDARRAGPTAASCRVSSSRAPPLVSINVDRVGGRALVGRGLGDGLAVPALGRLLCCQFRLIECVRSLLQGDLEQGPGLRRPRRFLVERNTSLEGALFCGLSRRGPTTLRAAVVTRAREDGALN